MYFLGWSHLCPTADLVIPQCSHSLCWEMLRVRFWTDVWCRRVMACPPWNKTNGILPRSLSIPVLILVIFSMLMAPSGEVHWTVCIHSSDRSTPVQNRSCERRSAPHPIGFDICVLLAPCEQIQADSDVSSEGNISETFICVCFSISTDLRCRPSECALSLLWRFQWCFTARHGCFAL